LGDRVSDVRVAQVYQHFAEAQARFLLGCAEVADGDVGWDLSGETHGGGGDRACVHGRDQVVLLAWAFSIARR
jgi:hypothetical protein